MAILAFDVLRLRRRVISRNLGIAFGDRHTEADRRRIGRASVYHFVLTVFEFVRGDCRDFAADVTIVGAAHLQTALTQGQGVYILCFHQGNWEAMGAKVSRAITPAHVVVKTVGGRGTDRFVSEVRAKNGFYAIKRRGAGDGLRAILQTLKRGEIVGFVLDQARPGEPRLPFFGMPAKTNTGLAALWRRRPAPVVPGFIRRIDFGRHVIELGPPLELAGSADAERDILQHTTQFNAVIASYIAQVPEQYFWLHNRWK